MLLDTGICYSSLCSISRLPCDSAHTSPAFAWGGSKKEVDSADNIVLKRFNKESICVAVSAKNGDSWPSNAAPIDETRVSQ